MISECQPRSENVQGLQMNARAFYTTLRTYTAAFPFPSHYALDHQFSRWNRKNLPYDGRTHSVMGPEKLNIHMIKRLRMVFTTDGVGVVIRRVDLNDLVKTAFWFRLRLRWLRSSEN